MVFIRPARSIDAEAITRMETRAFQTPMARWFDWTRPINLYESVKDTFDTINSPDKHNYVACDENGAIVGYCTYNVKGREAAEASSWLQSIETRLFAMQLYLTHIVTYIQDRASLVDRNRKFEIFDKAKKDNWQRLKETENLHEFVYLAILAVDPQYHKGGVGTKLLQLSIDEAKKQGLPLQLESSSAGYPFYMKKGFKEVGTPNIVKDGDKFIESFPNVILRP